MSVLQTVPITPTGVNPHRSHRIPQQTSPTKHETALTLPTPPEIPASHATNFSTMRVCNDSSTCFQAGNAQPSPPLHTVHYEHATAACNPEPSRELIQKLPSQGATPLTPRRLRPVAIRPQPSEALGNLGINCTGTHYFVSPAKRSNAAHRWQLCPSTPRGTRLDLKPKRRVVSAAAPDKPTHSSVQMRNNLRARGPASLSAHSPDHLGTHAGFGATYRAPLRCADPLRDAR